MSLTKKHSSSIKTNHTNHTKKNLVNQNENIFSILSFNIYGRGCNSFDSKLVDKLLKDNNIDVLCTQEDFGKNIYKPISNYKILPVIKNKSCGYKSSETVGVYEKIPNSINFDNCINSNQVYKKNNINRFSIIFNYKNIKIANLHLEGGRYTDQILLTDFETLLPIKLSLLEDIIKQEPDIILGDFNSVYCSNKSILNKFLEGQNSYFENVVKNDKLTKKDKSNIKQWNLEPFILLKKHGYTYAKPHNEATMITNGRGNSIIDFIFYKKNKVNLESSNIINIMNKSDSYKDDKCISDHNPIFAKFNLI
uniref:Endonuclease/exonuclease/phosphatase domain-containing protein n=1 Tax=viral metagenome TaxID=1070528 RepID=A0A6C0HMG1_9ZZZZ